MVGWIGQKLDWLTEHYVAVCLLLALFILSMVGVGDLAVVSMLGLLLCMVGTVQQSARADRWILFPFLVYLLFLMASSYAAYGNIAEGYGVTHLIFPTVYLLMACLSNEEQLLTRQFCAGWTGAAALAGILQFTFRAVFGGSARRMGGVIGNPNAMGIFLVIGWFALWCLLEEQGEEGRQRRSLLSYLEPVLLAALALTLSMGSFVALAAGICVILAGTKRKASKAGSLHPWRETFWYACGLLARASLGLGCGMLLYLAAARTDVPWVCLILLVYLAALVFCWKELETFLGVYPRSSAFLAACGIAVAAAAVLVRPSSLDTFAERLEMMENGLHYLVQSPLLGVGPYRWKFLNLVDSDKYFNTWHIHNVLLHVGVESGWVAMGMLGLIAVRVLVKKNGLLRKAEFTAFCVHSLMDTGFFYLGITSLVLLTVGMPGQDGKKTGSVGLKVFFGIFALIYAYGLYFAIKT